MISTLFRYVSPIKYEIHALKIKKRESQNKCGYKAIKKIQKHHIMSEFYFKTSRIQINIFNEEIKTNNYL